MNLKETVESWGLPEHFKKKGFKLSFDGKNLEIKDKNGELKFEMTVICHENVRRAFAASQKRDEIYLHSIQVIEPEDRKKGVAGFYLSKLVEYCKADNITTVTLGVVSSPETTDSIKNDHCLTHDELKKIYSKHLGEHMLLKFSGL